jgi:hypothetical protein
MKAPQPIREKRIRDLAQVDLVSDDCFVPEPEKQLSILSFAAHATRGLVRDQNTRRKTMFMLLVVALVLLFAGSTFLQSLLNPHQHPVWFMLFWFVCGWLTLTAMLLAVFDLLRVRLDARRAARMLQGKLSDEATPDSPRSTIDQ